MGVNWGHLSCALGVAVRQWLGWGVVSLPIHLIVDACHGLGPQGGLPSHLPVASLCGLNFLTLWRLGS